VISELCDEFRLVPGKQFVLAGCSKYLASAVPELQKVAQNGSTMIPICLWVYACR